MDFENAL
ncbi:d113292f-b125-488c-8b9d-20845e33460d [Thermothielavioides terrestris]|nr:d113292f-b125-488c-8b9d-20845e33460d [Thermothielavioides terrestris]